MSDPNAPDELPEAAAGPHRVIGTPPPAQARTLLGEVSGDGRERRPAPRQLPPRPPNPRPANKAARLVLRRGLGRVPGTALRHTVWRKGTRLLAYGANPPITPADFSSAGGMITVVPDGYQDNQDALAAATAIIIKFQPGVLQPPTVMNWTVGDIGCYSQICTHVGCPAALYEQTTHHILCPCHQSTFDAPRPAA